MNILQLQNIKPFYIHLFKWGHVLHGKGDFVVDREFYEKMKYAFDFLTKSNDRPPQYPAIKRQHGDDGFVYGLIKDIFSTDEQPPPEPFTTDGLYALVHPGPKLMEWREYGLIGDYSPGIDMNWSDVHTGKELQNVLKEVSFVSEGHLRNTEKDLRVYALSASGFIEEQHQERVMGEKEKEMEKHDDEKDMGSEYDEKKMEAVEGRLEKLESGMEAIAGQVGRLVAALEGGQEEDEKDMTDEKHSMSAKVKKLEERLQLETEKRVKSEARQFIVEKNIDLDEKEQDAILQLAVDQPEAFSATIRVLSAKAKKSTENSAYNFGEVGSVGDSSSSEEVSGIRKMCAEMKEDGKDRSYALSALGKKQLVNFMDEEQMAKTRKILDEVYQ